MSEPLAPGWEMAFSLAIATRSGESFQDLFAGIMERREAGFKRVRPWGNIGDRKNDGWSPTTRTLFQSYAPRSLSAAALEAKMVEDYEGAIEYWEEYFDTWVFVHNDLDGLAPPISLKLAELNARQEEVACDSWGKEEIRQQFALLSDADRVALLGPPLTPQDFLTIDAAALRPLIDHLGQTQPDYAAEVAPIPANKIHANELRHAQVAFLQQGAIHAPVIESFLSNSYLLPDVPDKIAEAVRSQYLGLVDSGLAKANVFDALLAWSTGGAIDASSLASGFAILAYFFERCHIFEATAAAGE